MIRNLNRGVAPVINTRSPISDMAWTAVACLLLVALLGWGHWVDSEAAAAEAYEAGRLAALKEAHEAVGAAYAQGYQDARARLQASAEVRP